MVYFRRAVPADSKSLPEQFAQRHTRAKVSHSTVMLLRDTGLHGAYLLFYSHGHICLGPRDPYASRSLSAVAIDSGSSGLK